MDISRNFIINGTDDESESNDNEKDSCISSDSNVTNMLVNY